MECDALENASAMREYLMKIWKIKWHRACSSDYDMFLSSARTFLHSCDSHAVFIKPICKAFRTCRKRRIIALLYSLSSLMKVDKFFIDEETVIGHFRHKVLWPSILQCMRSFNLCIMDAQVVRSVVFDRSYTCRSLYELVMSRKEYARDFMHKEDTALAYKQLNFIANCGITYNLEYFTRFLGSQSRIVAFMAFEAFNAVFQELERRLSCGNDPDQLPIPSCISFGKESPQLCLSMGRIVIEDSANFLQFGFEFLEERDEVVGLIESCTTNAKDRAGSLNAILAKYAESFADLDGPGASRISLCYRRRVPGEHETPVELQDFDFLFKKRTLRDVCDCYEF